MRHAQSRSYYSIIRAGEQYPALIVICVFIVTRALFSLLGGEYLYTPINFAKQYLDPLLLKNDLCTSLFYFHSQPPLFNFVLGLVLKLSPCPAITCSILFKTAGALIALLFLGTLRSFGLRPFFSLVLALLFMMNPTLMLYENLLYYTYIEIFLITAGIYTLSMWLSTQRVLFLILFFGCLTCLSLIRSLFHPAFILLTGMLLFVCVRFLMRQKFQSWLLAAVTVLFLAPCMLLCCKNMVMYDFFGTSSWAGMSLWKKTNSYEPDELARFHKQSVISSYALKGGYEPFRPVTDYLPPEKLGSVTCHHPSDCSVFKSTGKPNFNHAGYVPVSKALFHDAASLIAHNPSRFIWDSLCSYALTLWYSSDSVHALFMDNMRILKPLEDIYRYIYFGFIVVLNKHADPGLWVRTALISLVFFTAYLLTLLNTFTGHTGFNARIVVVCIVCIFIHAYTIIISSLIEFGENNRFRAPVDAAFIIVLAGNAIILKDRIFQKK